MSTNQSAEKILNVLDLLMRHFANGVTATDICKSTGYSAPNVSRYIATLEQAGWAERIPETHRIRASISVAKRAVAILNDLDAAQQRISDVKQRINNL